MKQLKFNDYIAARMKRNVIEGYNWCLQNNADSCKANTMIIQFDFLASKVRIKSQGQVYNYSYTVVGELSERVICKGCRKGFNIPFKVITTDEHYCLVCSEVRLQAEPMLSDRVRYSDTTEIAVLLSERLKLEFSLVKKLVDTTPFI